MGYILLNLDNKSAFTVDFEFGGDSVDVFVRGYDSD